MVILSECIPASAFASVLLCTLPLRGLDLRQNVFHASFPRAREGRAREGKYKIHHLYSAADKFSLGGHAAAKALPPGQSGQDQVMPKWVTLVPQQDNMCEAVVLSISQPQSSVVVRNEEMSWEPFYARLVGDHGISTLTAAAAAVEVTPTSGNLAPRGGANNVCDPNKPYKDNVTINICLSKQGFGYFQYLKDGGEDELSNQRLFLVVQTEQRSWTIPVRLRAGA